MSAIGHSAKPQISVTQPATVTACAHGWPRLLAMCPGSDPAMKKIAMPLATRMSKTIQAKTSIMRAPSPLIFQSGTPVLFLRVDHFLPGVIGIERGHARR